MMKARVTITLKNGVLDPQGQAVHHALGTMGFDTVNSVRQGKILDIDLATDDRAVATAALTEMCEKLLANMVIEDYHVDLLTA
ncbi:MAG: phosphoribosylformylglycinamidine synthase subunit PurS [Pseudomonadota bacterium]